MCDQHVEPEVHPEASAKYGDDDVASKRRKSSDFNDVSARDEYNTIFTKRLIECDGLNSTSHDEPDSNDPTSDPSIPLPSTTLTKSTSTPTPSKTNNDADDWQPHDLVSPTPSASSCGFENTFKVLEHQMLNAADVGADLLRQTNLQTHPIFLNVPIGRRERFLRAISEERFAEIEDDVAASMVGCAEEAQSPSFLELELDARQRIRELSLQRVEETGNETDAINVPTTSQSGDDTAPDDTAATSIGAPTLPETVQQQTGEYPEYVYHMARGKDGRKYLRVVRSLLVDKGNDYAAIGCGCLIFFRGQHTLCTGYLSCCWPTLCLWFWTTCSPVLLVSKRIAKPINYAIFGVSRDVICTMQLRRDALHAMIMAMVFFGRMHCIFVTYGFLCLRDMLISLLRWYVEKCASVEANAVCDSVLLNMHRIVPPRKSPLSSLRSSSVVIPPTAELLKPKVQNRIQMCVALVPYIHLTAAGRLVTSRILLLEEHNQLNKLEINMLHVPATCEQIRSECFNDGATHLPLSMRPNESISVWIVETTTTKRGRVLNRTFIVACYRLAAGTANYGDLMNLLRWMRLSCIFGISFFIPVHLLDISNRIRLHYFHAM